MTTATSDQSEPLLRWGWAAPGPRSTQHPSCCRGWGSSSTSPLLWAPYPTLKAAVTYQKSKNQSLCDLASPGNLEGKWYFSRAHLWPTLTRFSDLPLLSQNTPSRCLTGLPQICRLLPIIKARIYWALTMCQSQCQVLLFYLILILTTFTK